ncbi:hypothetical protein Q5752_003075 [Cryptotrichosporon argae]
MQSTPGDFMQPKRIRITSSPSGQMSAHSKEQLRWLGESPDMHLPPHITQPSLPNAVPAELPLPVKLTHDPETYTSPTSIIYAHHNASTTTLGSGASLSASASIKAAKRFVPRLLIPSLVHLDTTTKPTDHAAEPADGAADHAPPEILPFSPVSPNPMEGYTVRVDAATDPAEERDEQPAFPTSPDSPGHSTFGVPETHGDTNAGERAASGPATPTASIAELLSRTGHAAKKARQS